MNTKLLSLKTAAGTTHTTTGFNISILPHGVQQRRTDAEDVLSVLTSDAASPGIYEIKVTTLAAAQKLSSPSYGSQTTLSQPLGW